MGKDENTPAQGHETEHLASQVVVQKKSKKTLYIVIALVLAIIIAIVAGIYMYKVNVLDPQAEKEAAAQEVAEKSAENKKLTPEEQITASLTDNLKKQTEALKQNDDTKYIKNSTSAATSVGRDLHEQDLKD